MASAIIVVVIFVLLALAILFICQNGGWQGGCGGNCASCHQHCSDKEKVKKQNLKAPLGGELPPPSG